MTCTFYSDYYFKTDFVFYFADSTGCSLEAVKKLLTSRLDSVSADHVITLMTVMSQKISELEQICLSQESLIRDLRGQRNVQVSLKKGFF